jgi:signal transduction histidine kinase
VEADGDLVRFVVCDTGTGISPGLVPHVFERNRQAAETASQGRGLGLFITKGIVEAHGGRIRVESEPGVGTAFEFCLPRVLVRPVMKTTASDEAPYDVSVVGGRGGRDEAISSRR